MTLCQKYLFEVQKTNADFINISLCDLWQERNVPKQQYYDEK
jgi:hypothetical protein